MAAKSAAVLAEQRADKWDAMKAGCWAGMTAAHSVEHLAVLLAGLTAVLMAVRLAVLLAGSTAATKAVWKVD